MKKIVIPTILTATVLIAGMFAFMPIEKAQTVHTTILAGTMEPFSVACTSVTLAAADDDGDITLTVDTEPIVLMSATFQTNTVATDADDTVAVTALTVDDAGIGTEAAATLTDVVFDAAPTEGDILSMFSGADAQTIAPLIVDDVATLTIDGTVNTGTSTYIITFKGLKVTGEDDPVCDVTGLA
jgi:hypothetical protein